MIWLILYCYVLWVLFIAVMALKTVWKTLPIVTKILAAPWVLIAFTMDVLLNLVATIFFFDLPKEWTLSQRLGRYMKHASWRETVAKALCSNLLDPFEVGGHCSR